MMRQVQLAARVDSRLKAAVESYCESRGLKMGKFIETAILDKLEELQDIEDVKHIRHEPTRPLSEVVKELKLGGLL